MTKRRKGLRGLSVMLIKHKPSNTKETWFPDTKAGKKAYHAWMRKNEGKGFVATKHKVKSKIARKMRPGR